MIKKVFIATPSYAKDAPGQFALSLKHSMMLLSAKGIESTWEYWPGCCYLPVARNKLVQMFLESDCTDMIFLDADLSWHPEAMYRLLTYDVDIVAGIYPFKLEDEGYPVLIDSGETGQPIVDLSTGLIQCGGVPTGFMRIRREVFDRFLSHYGDDLVIDEVNDIGELSFAYYNFFDCEKVGRRWIGEDYNFCRRWLDLGGKIYACPDIDFIHIGSDGREYRGNLHQWLLKQPGGMNSPECIDGGEYPGNDIDGWMTDGELRWLYSQAKKYKSIVEIGSWKGRSAHALLSGCSGKVYCIDKWTQAGFSVNGRIDTDVDAENRLKEFTSNLEYLLGNNGKLNIIHGDSIVASHEFESRSIDMVFIDGDHSVEGVVSDIIHWSPKAKKLLCGHDYDFFGWPDVKKVVDGFFAGHVRLAGTIWYVDIESWRKQTGGVCL